MLVSTSDTLVEGGGRMIAPPPNRTYGKTVAHAVTTIHGSTCDRQELTFALDGIRGTRMSPVLSASAFERGGFSPRVLVFEARRENVRSLE